MVAATIHWLAPTCQPAGCHHAVTSKATEPPATEIATTARVPLGVFIVTRWRGIYPGAGVRTWVFRPLWYAQLTVLLLAPVGAAGALAGLPFGHAGLDWRAHVRQDPRYLRPSEVEVLCADAARARRELGWRPQESFESGLEKTVRWYLANRAWTEDITSGAYRNWVEQNYSARGRA